MNECTCGSYLGCAIHCDICKREMELNRRTSCPPLCNSCFDNVFSGND